MVTYIRLCMAGNVLWTGSLVWEASTPLLVNQLPAEVWAVQGLCSSSWEGAEHGQHPGPGSDRGDSHPGGSSGFTRELSDRWGYLWNRSEVGKTHSKTFPPKAAAAIPTSGLPWKKAKQLGKDPAPRNGAGEALGFTPGSLSAGALPLEPAKHLFPVAVAQAGVWPRAVALPKSLSRQLLLLRVIQRIRALQLQVHSWACTDPENEERSRGSAKTPFLGVPAAPGRADKAPKSQL